MSLLTFDSDDQSTGRENFFSFWAEIQVLLLSPDPLYAGFAVLRS